MIFTGWTLAQLAPWFAIGATAVTGLYLLRMRRRQVEVPFAALWEQVARQSESRKIWRQFRRIFSWLIQIMLLALVGFALLDPKPTTWLHEPTTLAIVIDRSLSMSAVSDTREGERRIDAAKHDAVGWVRTLRSMDRALVIAVGETVAALAPLTSDISVLLDTIDAIEPAFGEADLPRALALAEHAVRDQPGPRIVILTDGAVDPAGAEALTACRTLVTPCEVRQVVGPAQNLAITAFAARRYPFRRDQVEVLTEVSNLGDSRAAVLLDIEAGGVSLGTRRLELDPGERKREVIADLDAARDRITARLLPVSSVDDHLTTDLGPTLDDVAYAVVPPLKPLDVTLVTDRNDLFLEAALLSLDDHIRLQTLAIDRALETPPPPELAEAKLIIFDTGAEPLPRVVPETHVVFFDPWRHESGPCPILKRADVTRPFLTEQLRRHPLLDDVVLKDVNIARGTTLTTEVGDTVLVRSLGEPLAVLREREHATLAIGFDPRQSDFPLRTAFPLFIDNIVRFVEQRSPGFVASAPLGQSQELLLADLGLDPTGVTRIRVLTPGGVAQDTPVERGRFRLQAAIPGVYALTSLDGTSVGTTVDVAVNQADLEASDLHPRFAGTPAEELTVMTPAPPASALGGPLWTVIMLCCATIIALEWGTYHRRLTV